MDPDGNGVTAAAFAVGEWYVDPELCRICRGDTRVELRPKVVDLLVYLADHAGEVVRKERILEEVWQRRFVAETVLTRAIFELRRAFGDDAAAPSVIQTIPRRGYRLIAPVQRALVRPAVCETEAACVLVFGERRIPLPEGEHLIGRESGISVRIDCRTVSRRHARITVRSGAAAIEDLGSRNGTAVNGAVLDGPKELRSGDTILVGPVALVFRVTGIEGSTLDADAPAEHAPTTSEPPGATVHETLADS